MRNSSIGSIAALLLAVCATPAGANVVHNETTSGDLSTDYQNPTLVTVGVGSNQILGQTGRTVTGGPIDRDYFTITIPAGQALTAVNVLPNTQGDGVNPQVSFIGIRLGTQGTNPAGTQTAQAADLLGYYLVGINDIGNDILGTIGQSNLLTPAAQGFSGPLLGSGPAGTAYTFWLQETTVGSFSYGIDLQIAPVPVPAAVWLFGSALLGLLGIGRRRA